MITSTTITAEWWRLMGPRSRRRSSLPLSFQEREGLLNAKVWFSSIFHGEDSEAKDALMHLRRLVTQRETPDQSFAHDLSALFTHPGATAGYALARFVRPRWLVKSCRLEAIVEPEPDPDSRVTLSDERDQLGMRRVKVDWRLGENVKRTFDRNFANRGRRTARRRRRRGRS